MIAESMSAFRCLRGDSRSCSHGDSRRFDDRFIKVVYDEIYIPCVTSCTPSSNMSYEISLYAPLRLVICAMDKCATGFIEKFHHEAFVQRLIQCEEVEIANCNYIAHLFYSINIFKLTVPSSLRNLQQSSEYSADELSTTRSCDSFKSSLSFMNKLVFD